MTSIMNSNDPKYFDQASFQPHWQKVVQEKYDSFIVNQTWDLVTLPHGKNLVS